MTTVLNPKAKGIATMPTMVVEWPIPAAQTKQEKLAWFSTYPLICEIRYRIPFEKRQDVIIRIFKLVRDDYPVNLTAKDLAGAFEWYGTPQGGDYWSNLNDEYFGGNDD